MLCRVNAKNLEKTNIKDLSQFFCGKEVSKVEGRKLMKQYLSQLVFEDILSNDYIDVNNKFSYLRSLKVMEWRMRVSDDSLVTRVQSNYWLTVHASVILLSPTISSPNRPKKLQNISTPISLIWTNIVQAPKEVFGWLDTYEWFWSTLMRVIFCGFSVLSSYSLLRLGSEFHRFSVESPSISRLCFDQLPAVFMYFLKKPYWVLQSFLTLDALTSR